MEEFFEKPEGVDAEKPDPKRRGGRPGKGRLRIKADDITIPSVPPQKFYWCGVVAECPLFVLHAGGFDFPRYRQNRVPREDAPNQLVLSDDKFAGRVHAMTDDQVEKCLSVIKRKVFREGALLDMAGSRNKPYRPMTGDTPAAKYAYMVEVDSPDHLVIYTDGFRTQTLLEE